MLVAIVISQVNKRNGTHLTWNVYCGMATSKPAGDFAVDVCLYRFEFARSECFVQNPFLMSAKPSQVLFGQVLGRLDRCEEGEGPGADCPGESLLGGIGSDFLRIQSLPIRSMCVAIEG